MISFVWNRFLSEFSSSHRNLRIVYSLRTYFYFKFAQALNLTNDESETTENNSEHSQVMEFF